jgi:alkyl hydroperoxide reductase subunit F
MYEVMIIGGGPAGLSAAVYSARKRLNTLLVCKEIGGQMNWTYHIENYLGYQFITAQELISKFQEQIDQFPIDRKTGKKITGITRTDGVFEALEESGEKYQGQSVIFATGKSPRRLEVPGEREFTGKGLSYCAICDGPLFDGQKVAVIGGGNSAIQAALDMVKIAEHVFVISLTKINADSVLIDKLSSAANLTLYIEHEVEKIEGDRFVSGLEAREIATGKHFRLDVTGVFVEIGLSPNSEAVRDFIPLNNRREILVNCSGETGVPGFFAAGDVTNVPEKQILVAAGEGAKAALQAHDFLQRLTT